MDGPRLHFNTAVVTVPSGGRWKGAQWRAANSAAVASTVSSSALGFISVGVFKLHANILPKHKRWGGGGRRARRVLRAQWRRRRRRRRKKLAPKDSPMPFLFASRYRPRSPNAHSNNDFPAATPRNARRWMHDDLATPTRAHFPSSRPSPTLQGPTTPQPPLPVFPPRTEGPSWSTTAVANPVCRPRCAKSARGWNGVQTTRPGQESATSARHTQSFCIQTDRVVNIVIIMITVICTVVHTPLWHY